MAQKKKHRGFLGIRLKIKLSKIPGQVASIVKHAPGIGSAAGAVLAGVKAGAGAIRKGSAEGQDIGTQVESGIQAGEATIATRQLSRWLPWLLLGGGVLWYVMRKR